MEEGGTYPAGIVPGGPDKRRFVLESLSLPETFVY